MNAGTLRHRVTLQRRTVTRDSYGGETVTWADVATVWARRNAIGGREYYGAGQTLAESTSTYDMRYRRDVVPAMRLVHGLNVLDILVVIPDAKNAMLTVGCREVSV
jgi:SPP1 family predicted phage head-tail adaptor